MEPVRPELLPDPSLSRTEMEQLQHEISEIAVFDDELGFEPAALNADSDETPRNADSNKAALNGASDETALNADTDKTPRNADSDEAPLVAVSTRRFWTTKQ